MGAIVSATDVRIASKEQVESLGGKFLMVEQSENLETAGGYAKEATDEFKKQAELMREALKKNDIVICTALIPGKPAPKILNEDLVKLMKPGSVIYDLAAENGGNSAFSEPGKINVINGIKVIGVKNLMNKLPITASNLYAKNVFSFIRNLYSKEKKSFNVNMEDEIIKSTLVKGLNNGNRSFYIQIEHIYTINFCRLLRCFWSVTPSLHTPLMSVTNAISSVIIVGAIIAALASSDIGKIEISNIFGFLAIVLAAINIFGGFLVTQRMLQMYKKRKKIKNDFTKFVSYFLLNLRNIIHTCTQRSIFT